MAPSAYAYSSKRSVIQAKGTLILPSHWNPLPFRTCSVILNFISSNKLHPNFQHYPLLKLSQKMIHFNQTFIWEHSKGDTNEPMNHHAGITVLLYFMVPLSDTRFANLTNASPTIVEEYTTAIGPAYSLRSFFFLIPFRSAMLNNNIL